MYCGRDLSGFHSEESCGGGNGEYSGYDKEYEEKKLRKAEYEAGLQQGERLGIEKGEQEGLNRGLAQGIVETGCAYGVSKKEILERLQERLNISARRRRSILQCTRVRRSLSPRLPETGC